MGSKRSTREASKRIARRIPEEIASEGSIELVDELFAEDVVARIAPLGSAEDRDAFGLHGQLGLADGPGPPQRPDP